MDKRIVLDDDGVPIVNYGYVENIFIGKQRNPVTVCNTTEKYYSDYIDNNSSKAKVLFMNCAEWLVNNSKEYNNYKLLEYNFPWPRYNIKPPWRSGLAQGLAIQILI